MLNVKAPAMEGAGDPAQRPYELVRAYNRDVGRSITIGSAFMYGGLALGAALLVLGAGVAATLALPGGLGMGYHFGHRRVLRIDRQIRSQGLPAQHSVVDR